MRVSNGLARHKRHSKFTALAKGFRLGRKNVYKQVRLALVKQGQHAYEGRKEKKRDFRKLWIERLSAAIRTRGGKYSTFVNKMDNKSVIINRKILSNIAIVFPSVFDKIYDMVQNDVALNPGVKVSEKKAAPKAKKEVAEEKTETVEKKAPAKKAPAKTATKTAVKPAAKKAPAKKKAE